MLAGRASAGGSIWSVRFPPGNRVAGDLGSVDRVVDRLHERDLAAAPERGPVVVEHEEEGREQRDDEELPAGPVDPVLSNRVSGTYSEEAEIAVVDPILLDSEQAGLVRC